ncbi:MAG: hypothetical protein KA020_16410 [Planctomycetes bacterium]|nr:hypothetical protein [Planctomycetota bacterium]
MLRPQLLLVVFGLAAAAVAQLPVLAPTASTTINVDATFGHLAYSAITIPAGVSVRFTGHYPVRITVSGDVRVDGELSVTPWLPFEPGPGGLTTVTGTSGQASYSPGYWASVGFGTVWVNGHWSGSWASNGRHATLYGTAFPFDLDGGSEGGTQYNTSLGWDPYAPPWPAVGTFRGGSGGGTLVIEAAGRIDVFGTVTADGWASLSTVVGSGGSILLRGLRGCQVAGGATVTAMPEGIVRLDAYGLPPQIAGTVQPAPTIARYPDLTETVPPAVGGTWQMRVAAPRGDVVFLAASFQPGSGTNQYGTFGIDLGNAITFAVVTIPATGHDPLATFSLPVPNVPHLVGLSLWVQGLDWFTSMSPRYTQTVATWVR